METLQNFFSELIHWIVVLDKNFFGDLNAINSPFFDKFMFFISSKYTWIPLYISLLFYLIKNKKRESILIIVSIILLVTFADQFASGLCKPLFARLRPSHDPSLVGVHLVAGHKSSLYGFISSHAAITMAVAMFTSLLFKRTVFIAMIFSWALLNSYSRVYLGVHFPLDVIVGGLSGLLWGGLLYRFLLVLKRKFPQYNYTSHKNNSRVNEDFPLSSMSTMFSVYTMSFFFIVLFSAIDVTF